MAYDSLRGRTLLFGGYGASGQITDLWSWNGQAWQLDGASTHPGEHAQHAMVLDKSRGRVVLFGAGWLVPGLGTWEWDGAAWRPALSITTPSPRYSHAMAEDPSPGRVLLFGGWLGGSRFAGDTWTWDGTQWQALAPALAPPPRSDHAMTLDTARRRVLLFGGSGAGSVLGDTWEWDGTVWATVAPSPSPPPRSGHALATDPGRSTAVLFGGKDAAGAYLGDTWEWSQGRWTQRFPLVTPAPRHDHAMAHDPSRQRIVLFGGQGWASTFQDAWEWDGTTWTAIAMLGMPSRRYGHAMATDPWGRVLMHGGTWNIDNNETWLYGSLRPGYVTTLGPGCSGTTTPLLGASLPVLGTPGSLDVVAAPPLAPCAIGLSAASQAAQVGPCMLYLQAPVLLIGLGASATGFATLPLALPPNPWLRGAALHAQAFVLDASATLGVSVTNGAQLVLGDA